MNTSRFFLHTLIAAAAMTVPAYADINLTQSSSTHPFGAAGGTSSENITLSDGLTGTLTNQYAGHTTLTGTITGDSSSILKLSGNANYGAGWILNGSWENFYGTVSVGNRGPIAQILITGNGDSWSNTSVSLDNNTTANQLTALVVDAATTIKGISSEQTNSRVVASSLGNTLTINTAGSDFSYAGTVGSGEYMASDQNYYESRTQSGALGLVKVGEGSQTITGSVTLSTLSVSGGTLNLNGATSIANAVTVSGGTLNLSGTNNLSGKMATVWEGELSLSGNSVVSSAVAVMGGELSLDGTITLSSTIQNSGTVTLADSVIFDLVNLEDVDGVYTVINNQGDGEISTSDTFSFSNSNVLIDGEALSSRLSASYSNGAITITGNAASLVWNGGNGAIWNTTESDTVWLTSGTENANYFATDDSVTFTDAAPNKTISLAANESIRVRSATVASGEYIWQTTNGNSASVSGETLVVEKGALLTAGQTGGGTGNSVLLDFATIELGGELRVKSNQTQSWNTLVFKDNDAVLNLYEFPHGDTTTDLTIDKVQMDTNGRIKSAYTKSVSVSALSGSGDLTIEGSSATDRWGCNLTYTLGSLDGYSGTLSLVDKDNGEFSYSLTVNTSWSGTTDASFNIGAGCTLNLEGEDDLSVNEIVVGEGAALNFNRWSGQLNYNNLTFKSDSTFSFINGNSDFGSTIGDADSQIEIDAAGGTVTFNGSGYGSSVDIQGSISGEGTLKFTTRETNPYKVSANIADGSNGALALNFAMNEGQTVTISGENTYSGETTISGGKVVAQGDSALGSGAVNITAGTLSLGGERTAKVTNNVTMASGSKIEISGANAVTLGAVSKSDATGGELHFSGSSGVLELTGALALNRLVSMADSLKIDFGTVGRIDTTGKTSEWGGGVNIKQNSSLEFIVSLTESQIADYNLGKVVFDERILLTAKDPDVTNSNTNGIWNIGDSNALNILVEVAEGVYLDSSLYQGRVTSVADVELGKYAHIWQENTTDGTSYFSIVVNIPEPSAFGLLAGVGALALVASRRRSRR